VGSTFGEDHLGAATDAANAAAAPAPGPVQDAHEAIRPTRVEVAEAPVADDDARKLYRLVRARTLASQMAPSRTASRGIEAACDGLERPLTGTVTWRTFDGWEAAYGEFLRARPTAPPAIALDEGAVWTLDPPTEERANPLLVEDETRPPGRYRAHTLIKAMKDAGIGRPSTYSRTVDKLEERGYVETDDAALVPTERGRSVWLEAAPLYAREADEGHEAAELFSPAFTALMEARLDAIESGEAPAPATWEAWREEIRDLHEAARMRRDAGESTPQQIELLTRLLANAPADFARPAGDLAALSYQQARDLARRLREAGVQPRPSQAQLDLVARLLDDLALDDDELAEVLGPGGVDTLTSSARASRVIDDLQRLKDERRPASGRQRRYVDDLVAEAGLSEGEAAGLVGLTSLDELTGGRQGSASALIEALKARVGEAAAAASTAGGT
jgi:DNA-binding MarR family transcriptional regulator